MMNQPSLPRPLAITMGDPAGIGPEIVVKCAADPTRVRVPVIAIGDAGTLRRAAATLGYDLPIEAFANSDEAIASALRGEALPVLQAGPALPDTLPLGQVHACCGEAAFAYIEQAIDLALAGKIAGMVTAPINKEALAAAGVPFPGHTEILAHRSGTRDFGMMLVNDDLRVMLVSIHLSLIDAIRAVTRDNELRAIRLAHLACLGLGIAQPKVAVAGLNPHAGENGLFGREDLDMIAPAVEQARREGIDASGPWPGDTLFMRARQGDFDIVVAQYHDQGLIPIKYLGIDAGVNVTVGLPFVRTSVDHGTAFDIARTGRASHASLLSALKQAAALAHSGQITGGMAAEQGDAS